MSVKERVVFLDRAAFTTDDLPVPNFDHNWSEYPETEAADVVPRLFWATTVITHACPIDSEAIAQLHKLTRIVVIGSAIVDAAACGERGVVLHHLPQSETPARSLVDLLEMLYFGTSS